MLPLWVRTAGFWLFPPIAFAYAWCTTRVAMALANPRAQSDAHWTEQARQLYPRRVAFAMTFWAQLAFWTLLAAFFSWHGRGSFAALPPIFCAIPVILGSMIAGMAASRGASITQHSLRARLLDFSASMIIRMLFVFAWILIALTLSDHALLMTFAGLLALFATWSGAGLYVAQALRLLRPASARLQAIVARAAASTGVTPRGVLEARMISTNAFAFIGAGKVIFTDGALKNLTDGELEAVAAHALGHLGEPRRLSRARLVPIFLLVTAFVIALRSDARGRRAARLSAAGAATAQADESRVSGGRVARAAPFVALVETQAWLRAHPPDGERAALVALAIVGADANLLSEAARGAGARQDYARSAALYGEASEDRPTQAIYPAYQARAFLWAKRCPEAIAALGAAQARLTDGTSKHVRSEVEETAAAVAAWCPAP